MTKRRLTPEQQLMCQIEDLREIESQAQAVLNAIDQMRRGHEKYRPWLWNPQTRLFGDFTEGPYAREENCVGRERYGAPPVLPDQISRPV